VWGVREPLGAEIWIRGGVTLNGRVQMFSPVIIYWCLPVCHLENVKIKIHRTIILNVVLCESEFWSLALREEHRLRVFENRVLRRIFGHKRKELCLAGIMEKIMF
jgi:hypothetical protein